MANKVPFTLAQMLALDGMVSANVWDEAPYTPKGGNWLPFEEARAIVREQHFRNGRDYQNWSARPTNIPASPRHIYPKQWVSMGDWLGNGNFCKGVFRRAASE